MLFAGEMVFHFQTSGISQIFTLKIFLKNQINGWKRKYWGNGPHQEWNWGKFFFCPIGQCGGGQQGNVDWAFLQASL